MDDPLPRLRALSTYHAGIDLPARLAEIETRMAQMRAGLSLACDEIERLRAALQASGAKRLP